MIAKIIAGLIAASIALAPIASAETPVQQSRGCHNPMGCHHRH